MYSKIFRPSPPTFFLILQIIAHLSLIPMIWYGTLNQWLICLCVYFFTGCLGMSMTYHRLLAHQSWLAPPWFLKFGVICASLGLTGTPIAWTAIHRQHHMFTDRKKDPHSPHKVPWWDVQFLSMYYKPDLHFVKDLLKDPFLVWMHRNYLIPNIIYIIALCLLMGPFAVVYGFLLPAAILWQAGSSVNTIGHLYGYTNHPTNNHSKNNLLIGYLAWGEGWHNNHHKNPKKKSFKHKPWEIDIAGSIIRLIEKPRIHG